MKRCLIFFLLTSLWLPVLAQRTANGTFAVSRISMSPVSSAQAGSMIASQSGDVMQLSVNPALIDSSVNRNLAMSYLRYLSGLNQAAVAYAHQLDGVGFMSGYLRYMDYGTFTETDEVGNEHRTFKASDYELGLSFTRPYSDKLAYGVTLKQYVSNYFFYTAYGFALDVGAYYNNGKGFTAGLTVDDIGVVVRDYRREGARLLPANASIGVAKKFEKAPLRLSLQYNHLEQWDLAAVDVDAQGNVNVDVITGETKRKVVTMDNLLRHLGLAATFMPSDNLNLFIGYNFQRRLELAVAERPGTVGFTAGGVFKVKKFQLQYAVSSFSINGATHQFGLATNLGQWKKSTAP